MKTVNKKLLARISVLLVLLLLIAFFAPIPVPYNYPEVGTADYNSMLLEDNPDGLVTPYHASRMTDWALIRTIHDYDPSFTFSLSATGFAEDPYESLLDRYPPLAELERRFFLRPGEIMTKMILHMLIEKWRYADAEGYEKYSYSSLRSIVHLFYRKLNGTYGKERAEFYEASAQLN